MILLILAVAVGGMATFAWWRSDGVGADLPFVRWFGTVLVSSCLTFANILVRWVKWRFLCRRNGIRMPARKGLGVYLATLPAILTPFYIGELMRIPMLGLPVRPTFHRLVRIFLLERGADALALVCLLSLGNLPVLAALAIVCIAVPFFLRGGRRAGWSVAVLLSILAWSLPVVSLAVFDAMVDGGIGIRDMAQLFSRSTLLGGLTGLPMGAGVTGSSLLGGFLDAGIARPDAVWMTTGFRMATTWFALAVGLAALIVLVARLRSATRSGNHFDAIADQYVDEIPGHIRDHLLHRKIDAILDGMGGVGGKDGLDVGCGQGAYALQFAEKGARMVGVDLSRNQLEWARKNAGAAELKAGWEQASADKLPFPDARFDFVYCVNMLHHMESEEAQLQALREMGRVLRSGGRIFVHEMNPFNPLFRFYMGYLFPVLNAIDEGTEWWIDPGRLPGIDGGKWKQEKHYFTFVPDFVPMGLWKLLRPLEAWLERSRWNAYSAHYMAVWEKA
ncbi:Demethylrebeccamycin-D-glucose O-methyltransferase [Pontiella desulfatans]|uniref:Demethylrebeccamycin-D-glucose O-methyltransferase n=2 Tax=Pontiella desulfatans TaxID=2750659 RepID=A0A6C2TXD0_PONDE|nr:Demethylrebeccamycin-D-glucose O-methyltransferase [Pontiella desulfatans]